MNLKRKKTVLSKEKEKYCLEEVKTYLSELETMPKLSVKEKNELFERLYKGDLSVKEILIKSHLKLVVHVAKKNVGRGLDFADLIQEGFFGLIKAIDNYDLSRNDNFTFFATSVIYDYMTRAISCKSRNIRLPEAFYKKTIKYRTKIIELEGHLDKKILNEKVAEYLNISIDSIKRIENFKDDTISLEDIRKRGYEEQIEALKYTTLEDEMLDLVMRSDVRYVLENVNLTTKELEVLYYRFGFYANIPLSLYEVSKKMNLSRERVRQLELQALTKIRKSDLIDKLKDYALDQKTAVINLETCLEEDNNKKEIEKNKRKEKIDEIVLKVRIKTIYQYFSNYSKKSIDLMLLQLEEEEKELIKLRYGEDLNTPPLTKLTKEQSYAYYCILVPKMKKILSSLDYQQTEDNKCYGYDILE